VEDNDLFRKNIAAFIEEQNDMVCSGIYDSCEICGQRQSGRWSTPDVILHDIGFRGHERHYLCRDYEE
jgi:DNA-binding NarL/FixJ family response regulator